MLANPLKKQNKTKNSPLAISRPEGRRYSQEFTVIKMASALLIQNINNYSKGHQILASSNLGRGMSLFFPPCCYQYPSILLTACVSRAL